MQSFATVVLLSALLQASQVFGHGYVSQVTIAGKNYNGIPPAEGGQRGASAVRQILNTQPVKGSDNPQLACGTGATSASLQADAQPGDTVAFRWVGAGGINWIHKVGPILTYMASCGSGSCDKFDPKNAEWFKISELGKKPNGDWYMADVFNGQTTEAKIPSTLKAGNYLIRNELIAIHNGMTVGGAEFYPSCTQLRVGGSQSGTPAASDLVKLPGAYKDNDPGIFVPDLFNPGFKYTLPGPAIAKIAAGNGGGAPAPAPAPSSTKDANTSKPAPSQSPSPSPSPSPAEPSTPSAKPEVPPPAVNAGGKPTDAPSSAPALAPTSAPSAPASAPAPASTRVCKRQRRSMAKREVPSPPAVPASLPLRSHGGHSKRSFRSRLDHGSYAVL